MSEQKFGTEFLNRIGQVVVDAIGVENLTKMQEGYSRTAQPLQNVLGAMNSVPGNPIGATSRLMDAAGQAQNMAAGGISDATNVDKRIVQGAMFVGEAALTGRVSGLITPRRAAQSIATRQARGAGTSGRRSLQQIQQQRQARMERGAVGDFHQNQSDALSSARKSGGSTPNAVEQSRNWRGQQGYREVPGNPNIQQGQPVPQSTDLKQYPGEGTMKDIPSSSPPANNLGIQVRHALGAINKNIRQQKPTKLEQQVLDARLGHLSANEVADQARGSLYDAKIANPLRDLARDAGLVQYRAGGKKGGNQSSIPHSPVLKDIRQGTGTAENNLNIADRYIPEQYPRRSVGGEVSRPSDGGRPQRIDTERMGHFTGKQSEKPPKPAPNADRISRAHEAQQRRAEAQAAGAKPELQGRFADDYGDNFDPSAGLADRGEVKLGRLGRSGEKTAPRIRPVNKTPAKPVEMKLNKRTGQLEPPVERPPRTPKADPRSAESIADAKKLLAGMLKRAKGKARKSRLQARLDELEKFQRAGNWKD